MNRIDIVGDLRVARRLPLARLVADKLRVTRGQPVLVENKPGASIRLAVQAVRSAEPNGQTLLVTPDAIVTVYPHVFKDVGYDPFKDLTPIFRRPA